MIRSELIWTIMTGSKRKSIWPRKFLSKMSPRLFEIMYMLVETNYLKITEGLYDMFMIKLMKSGSDIDKALFDELLKFESNKEFNKKRIKKIQQEQHRDSTYGRFSQRRATLSRPSKPISKHISQSLIAYHQRRYKSKLTAEMRALLLETLANKPDMRLW